MLNRLYETFCDECGQEAYCKQRGIEPYVYTCPSCSLIVEQMNLNQYNEWMKKVHDKKYPNNRSN